MDVRHATQGIDQRASRTVEPYVRGAAARPIAMPTPQTQTLDREMQNCLDACTDCFETCERTLAYCLSKGGDHARPEHIALLIDCARICETSAGFLARDSPLHGAVCGACAEACERCAESCERLADDPVLKECADVCRKCAASCRSMAG